MAQFSSNKNMKRLRKPLWMEIASAFPDDRDCLAAFIAFEAAEVLEGVKPSSLINLPDRPRNCGRNMYTIWKEYGENIVRESPLEAMVMAERSGSRLLLFYGRAALVRLLSNKGVFALLRKAGYQGNLDVDMLLSEFRTRFASGGIPHEIGIILGYPLKDVAGFMGVGRLRFTCQGPWRIYGVPQRSLMLAESHRQCRCRMAARLMTGAGPFECLGICGGATERKMPLFYPCIENESHYLNGGTPCASH